MEVWLTYFDIFFFFAKSLYDRLFCYSRHARISSSPFLSDRVPTLRRTSSFECRGPKGAFRPRRRFQRAAPALGELSRLSEGPLLLYFHSLTFVKQTLFINIQSLYDFMKLLAIDFIFLLGNFCNFNFLLSLLTIVVRIFIPQLFISDRLVEMMSDLLMCL